MHALPLLEAFLPKFDGALETASETAAILTLHEGDRIAIQGRSGSGKSRFLRSLAGLTTPLSTDHSGDPTDYRIRLINSSDESRCSSQASAPVSDILYLTQKPVFLPGTVEENLRMPFTFRAHRGRHFDRERLLGWMRACALDEGLLSRPAETLSGGESQIFHLFRSLQLEPRILFLDEPTSSLDSSRRESVETLLRQWVTEVRGRALVIVSHDDAQAARFATCIWRLEDGRFHVG